MPLCGACVRSELEDEGLSHHWKLRGTPPGRRESHVEAGVQFPFKLHGTAKRAIENAPTVVTILWADTFTPYEVV